MNTATEAIKERDKEHRKRAFELRLEAFLKEWSPDDHYMAMEFETQLIMLVREIYHDAQEPLLKHITDLAMVMPMPFGKSGHNG